MSGVLQPQGSHRKQGIENVLSSTRTSPADTANKSPAISIWSMRGHRETLLSESLLVIASREITIVHVECLERARMEDTWRATRACLRWTRDRRPDHIQVKTRSADSVRPHILLMNHPHYPNRATAPCRDGPARPKPKSLTLSQTDLLLPTKRSTVLTRDYSFVIRPIAVQSAFQAVFRKAIRPQQPSVQPAPADVGASSSHEVPVSGPSVPPAARRPHIRSPSPATLLAGYSYVEPKLRKIPKPPGEAGRPGHGGYSLESELGWDAGSYVSMRVSLNVAALWTLLTAIIRPRFMS